ncbi:MAG TPA: recombinase family protein [Gemmatimonadaceae bacterium]|nr:recombinase family protein [Gemmatimonadaceae bacterium]
MRAAIYVRVSTLDQNVDNQLDELKKYVQLRGWPEAVVYADHGVSGSKDRRPALDDLLKAARRRDIDVVVCWRLDRLGRSLRHLLNVLQELEALGVGFISLGEGLDLTTPGGRLHMHLLGAFAEFERCRIQERVRAGLARARRAGKRLGRPPRRITSRELQLTRDLSLRAAARELGVSSTHVHRARRAAAERSATSSNSDGAEHV